MAKSGVTKGTWLIIVSLVIALILTVIPLPELVTSWRPAWLMLVLSFWVIHFPNRVGLFWAFIFGLLMDVLHGTSMGVHSFSLAISTFMLQLLYKRLALFPLWKQSLSIGFISLTYIVIRFWLVAMTGKSVTVLPWPSVLVNIAVWPMLYLFLRNLSHYFKVK